MASWIKASEGIRYKEHVERKNGINPDRYYAIYFRQAGKQVEQALGWGSKGVTLDFAKKTLAELKNNYLTASGPVTLKEKRQIKQDVATEAARQSEILETENLTFRAYFENSYLPIQKTHKGKATWIKETGHAENWIFPVVGNFPLKTVSSFHIEQIKKSLLDAEKTPRTIQYCLATFRQVWNHARRAGIVSGDSPTRNVKIPKFDNQRQRFLTNGECSSLLDELKKKSVETYFYSVMSLDAGLRFSEVAGLQWQDIDLVRQTILLRDTKSGRNRTVYMTERVKAILSGMPKGAPDVLVFPGKHGGQMTEIGDAFKKAVDDLKLNQSISDDRLKCVFHSLRHTHASRLLEAGTDIYLVKTLLGHRNIATTERYLHVRADSLRDAIKEMERKNNH
ncbi:MAG: site-specific integrase [Deltaproteobacteria bacterium]